MTILKTDMAKRRTAEDFFRWDPDKVKFEISQGDKDCSFVLGENRPLEIPKGRFCQLIANDSSFLPNGSVLCHSNLNSKEVGWKWASLGNYTNNIALPNVLGIPVLDYIADDALAFASEFAEVVPEIGFSFLAFPEHIALHLVGATAKFGEAQGSAAWASMGKHINNPLDPVVRLMDVANQLFYPVVDIATFHAPNYLMNDKLGMNIPYFSEPESLLSEGLKYAMILGPAGFHIARRIGKSNSFLEPRKAHAKQPPKKQVNSKVKAAKGAKIKPVETWATELGTNTFEYTFSSRKEAIFIDASSLKAGKKVTIKNASKITSKKVGGKRIFKVHKTPHPIYDAIEFTAYKDIVIAELDGARIYIKGDKIYVQDWHYGNGFVEKGLCFFEIKPSELGSIIGDLENVMYQMKTSFDRIVLYPPDEMVGFLDPAWLTESSQLIDFYGDLF